MFSLSLSVDAKSWRTGGGGAGRWASCGRRRRRLSCRAVGGGGTRRRSVGRSQYPPPSAWSAPRARQTHHDHYAGRSAARAGRRARPPAHSFATSNAHRPTDRRMPHRMRQICRSFRLTTVFEPNLGRGHSFETISAHRKIVIPCCL